MGTNFGKFTAKSQLVKETLANFNVYNVILVLNKVLWLKKLWEIYGHSPNPPMFPPSKVSLYMVFDIYFNTSRLHSYYTRCTMITQH